MNEYDKFIDLKRRCNIVLNDVEQIIQEVKDSNLQDEQFILEFEDKLNCLSVVF